MLRVMGQECTLQAIVSPQQQQASESALHRRAATAGLPAPQSVHHYYYCHLHLLPGNLFSFSFFLLSFFSSFLFSFFSSFLFSFSFLLFSPPLHSPPPSPPSSYSLLLLLTLPSSFSPPPPPLLHLQNVQALLPPKQPSASPCPSARAPQPCSPKPLPAAAWPPYLTWRRPPHLRPARPRYLPCSSQLQHMTPAPFPHFYSHLDSLLQLAGPQDSLPCRPIPPPRPSKLPTKLPHASRRPSPTALL